MMSDGDTNREGDDSSHHEHNGERETHEDASLVSDATLAGDSDSVRKGNNDVAEDKVVTLDEADTTARSGHADTQSDITPLDNSSENMHLQLANRTGNASRLHNRSVCLYRKAYTTRGLFCL